MLEVMFLDKGTKPSIVTEYALDLAESINPENPFATLGFLIFAIITVKTLFLVIMIKFQLEFTWQNRSFLSGRLFEYYINNPYSFHIGRNSANLLRNVTDGVAVVLIRLVMPALILVTETMVVFTIVTLLAFVAPRETLFACLVLPSSEKSQSFASFLTLSLLIHFAFSKGTNFEAKVVLPEPGKPIIKIFFIIYLLKDDVTLIQVYYQLQDTVVLI